MPRRHGPVVALLALAAALLAPAAAQADPRVDVRTSAAPASNEGDAFFTYDGAEPLSSYGPGEVLKTRTVPFHVAGIRTPVKVVQLLYRATDAQQRPSANVTSVVMPPGGSNGTKAVSYQSFYDSLNPADSPSRIFAGDVTFGGAIANIETVFLAPLLAQGYPVIVSDTQGATANFAAGPEYGTNTLDSIRAAQTAPETGLDTDSKIGLIGYSGGAIATNWASVLAPSYAPDVAADLVGAAEGGLLVAPARNLRYVSGSLTWAGIAPMAIVGVARAYGIDFAPYLNDYGKRVVAKLERASIVNVLGQYPGLTWQKLVKPAYADPNSVPEFVEVANSLNLGQLPSPRTPMFIGQGAGGVFEGTSGSKAGIGAGDGVMIAGDVRTLARQYCADGTRVKHVEYPLLSHTPAALTWAPAAIIWLGERFAGKQAPSNCGLIRPGNSLAPEVGVPPTA